MLRAGSRCGTSATLAKSLRESIHTYRYQLHRVGDASCHRRLSRLSHGGAVVASGTAGRQAKNPRPTIR
jgi:hypothetical protein